jgi:hypothetical protein
LVQAERQVQEDQNQTGEDNEEENLGRRLQPHRFASSSASRRMASVRLGNSGCSRRESSIVKRALDYNYRTARPLIPDITHPVDTVEEGASTTSLLDLDSTAFA